MDLETLTERRMREVACFNEQPIFPEGCTSWKEFLFFCSRKEGEPFTLTLHRCFGLTTKSIEEYYFFGVTHAPENLTSFGRECFTPLNFSTRTATALGSLTQSDLGLVQELPYECKVISISFDTEVFGETLLDQTLFLKGNLLTFPENYMYMSMMLGYLSRLRNSFPHHQFKKFDAEIEKMETKLNNKTVERDLEESEVS